jgi:hypothetical protein
MSVSRFTVTYEDDEGLEHEVHLPANWEICGDCRGEGKSSAYLGAFTAEDMHEDPDFADDYMAGHYDRTCDTCHGKGRVLVPDHDACQSKPEWKAALDRRYQRIQDAYEDAAVYRAEMRLIGDY